MPESTHDARPQPPVIGLTGPVAAGKSTAARLLAAAECHVIDVDALGHLALGHPEVVAAVRRLFGDAVVGPDGRLEHAAVAARVFEDDEALRELEAIVHPRVREDLADALSHALARRPRAVVIDAALLFEGGLDDLCDETVCVDAPATLRRTRARTGRGWSDDEVERREAQQLAADEKRSRASRVLENDGDLAALQRAVQDVLREIAPLPVAAVRGDAEDDR